MEKLSMESYVKGLTSEDYASGESSRCHCLRCNHVWFQRVAGKPKQCPRCRGENWDEIPKKKPKPRSGISGITWSRKNLNWMAHFSSLKSTNGVMKERRIKLGHFSTIYAAAKALLQAHKAAGIYTPQDRLWYYVNVMSHKDTQIHEQQAREARGRDIESTEIRDSRDPLSSPIGIK